MRNLLLGIIALAALPGSALQAQNFTGTWQGNLKAGPQELRTVIKISLDDDKLKAILYSIDQKAQIPFSTVTKDGSTIKMAIAGLGGYEGKLSADGNWIKGTFPQGAPPPLNVTRTPPETAGTIPDPPPPPKLMPADANPVFEVATIKPSKPETPGPGVTFRGRDVVTFGTTLNFLIILAYDVHPKQIAGGPAWLETDKFDLTARPDLDGQPNLKQTKMMIQKLLADRFQLKFHREKKELAVYAMTVPKTGAKITKSQADPNSLPGLGFGRAPQGMVLNVRNATMAEVAGVLQGCV